MAVSRVGTPGTGTTTCTFPTHQAGDLLIVFAFRDGSTTPPLLPATWWNYFSETGANTCSMRVGYKIATGAGTSSGTWTNATTVIGAVYRGAVLGALIQGRGSSTTFSYNAISVMSFTNSTSWAGAVVFSRDGTNTTVPNVQIAPTGMTNVTSVKDTTDAGGIHDTNGTVSSWSTQTQATGVAATGWYTLVFELVATQTNILGYNVIGASTNTLTDYFVGASFDCTEAFTANVGKFYGNQNSGSGTYDFAIYEETSLNNYTFLSQATGTIAIGTTPAWNSFTINQALTVGTRYFIAFWSVDPFTFYFNTGARVGTTYATTGNTFNTWPSPELGGITDTAFISVYIENATIAYTITIDQGSYGVTGQAVNLLEGKQIAIAQGSYAINGQAVALQKGRTMTADSGSYQVNGQALSFLRSSVIQINQGSYTLSGQTVGLLKGSRIAITQGSYAVNGQSVSLLTGKNITISQGAYSLTGQAVSLINGKLLTCNQGSYQVNGQTLNLLRGLIISFAQGLYNITGYSVTLIKTGSYAINIQQGQYSINGQPVNLLASRILLAASGNYNIAGNSIDFLKGHRIQAVMGLYNLTGYDVILVKSSGGTSKSLALLGVG